MVDEKSIPCENCGHDFTTGRLASIIDGGDIRGVNKFRVLSRFNWLINRRDWLRKEAKKNDEELDKLFKMIEAIRK